MHTDAKERTTTLLFIREAASELRVSESTIRRAIQSGQLPALRLGEHGRLRVRADDVTALLRPVEAD